MNKDFRTSFHQLLLSSVGSLPQDHELKKMQIKFTASEATTGKFGITLDRQKAKIIWSGAVNTDSSYTMRDDEGIMNVQAWSQVAANDKSLRIDNYLMCRKIAFWIIELVEKNPTISGSICEKAIFDPWILSDDASNSQPFVVLLSNINYTQRGLL